MTAEIEALRMEIEGHRIAIQQLYDRAERLAEALREAYGQVRELCDCYGHAYPEASFAHYEALLRDYDKEEK